jgi:hypothetical protein
MNDRWRIGAPTNNRIISTSEMYAIYGVRISRLHEMWSRGAGTDMRRRDDDTVSQQP